MNDTQKELIFRLAWGTDAGFYRLVPQEVLHPNDESQVQAIFQRAHTEHKSITFRAAGTSLSGQAISDSLLVVIGKKWTRYQIHNNGETITLQPGIIGQRVNELLRPYGRFFTPDPASIKSAMVGGIIGNNASGMCCGVKKNSYHMLRSARLILADGTVLDTGNEKSKQDFRKSHPEFLKRIEELRQSVLADADLTALIRHKYEIKNVTGLTILPFVQYEDPFDIIAHLIVGSEGCLAFLSEAVMATDPIPQHAQSALLLFDQIGKACQAVTKMRHTGAVSAAELFDRKAIRVIENDFPELVHLSDTTTAVLIKIEAQTEAELSEKAELVRQSLSGIEPIGGQIDLTDDPEKVTKYWAMRSGIFPAVGATREIGTTCLIEDIAFPIDYLEAATNDLQALFQKHGYNDAVIYGHALEGNYHFILNQRFDTPEAIDQYDQMMRSVVDLVVHKYHGSLKAEHGTGRNMAPFVRLEWGDKAYQLMQAVKQLFDPENILNPGVIFNEDPKSYLQHIKPLPAVNAQIDRCIECGFCEVNCVSCGFALSSRQRIVISREIQDLKDHQQMQAAQQLERAFQKVGKDLCAGDGLCATSCPVGINVGEYIHTLRAQTMGKMGHRLGTFTAVHLNTIGHALRGVLHLASAAQTVLGNSIMTPIGRGLHRIGLPLWTPAMPHCTKLDQKQLLAQSATDSKETLKVVYFPSCLNQRLGLAKGDPSALPTMGDTVELLHKAGYEVIFPEKMETLCCGTIWESKGLPEQADQKAAELELALYRASENGRYPVLCDQSPCLYRMRHTMEHLHLYEPAEFIDKFVLDRLIIKPLDETILLHITCSMRKMGLDKTILSVAQKCAKKVVVPEEIGCCAFAGDKGFTEPELNDWALRDLRRQAEASGAKVGISNSRTCEIGLSSHSGIPYMNLVWLVNQASQPISREALTCRDAPK